MWGTRWPWAALKSYDIFLGSQTCTGLCVCPEKTHDGTTLSPLADFEFLHKPEVKALAKMSNSKVIKVYFKTHRESRKKG